MSTGHVERAPLPAFCRNKRTRVSAPHLRKLLPRPQNRSRSQIANQLITSIDHVSFAGCFMKSEFVNCTVVTNPNHTASAIFIP